MSIRVAIVDDEKPARDRIRRLIRDHADLTVVGEAVDVRSAVELIDRERPDLCFLDVQMPGGDGFDVLRRVRHIPRVVFTTAYDQYAVRAFEVNSLDYLLKPFDRKRFAAAMERVRESLGEEGEAQGTAIINLLERIPARRGARILLLDPDEVLCFEAEDTLVYARTRQGRYLVERTLADLEEQMAGRFFRTHRSYLVNLAQVGEILPGEAGTFQIMLRDGAKTIIPLSRRQARKLKERIPW